MIDCKGPETLLSLKKEIHAILIQQKRFHFIMKQSRKFANPYCCIIKCLFNSKYLLTYVLVKDYVEMCIASPVLLFHKELYYIFLVLSFKVLIFIFQATSASIWISTTGRTSPPDGGNGGVWSWTPSITITALTWMGSGSNMAMIIIG